jgi:hypothetical protein
MDASDLAALIKPPAGETAARGPVTADESKLKHG